jgi:glycosyltransferase involved in cell wall biosynthesis/SAM-dependent methyltransferase
MSDAFVPARPRVAIVCPIIARYDAISAAARDTWRAFAADRSFETALLTMRNDFAPEVPARVVSGVGDMLLYPEFISADLIIYHFGIYNELLDALVVGKDRRRQIVRFHNITPRDLAPPNQRTVLEKSFRQIHLLGVADEIWADSEVNAAVLHEYGIPSARIRVIPLMVENPAPSRLSDKATAPIEILYLGRFVPSKGVLDLIEATVIAQPLTRVPFRLTLAGNLEWSHAEYLRRIEETIARDGLAETIDFRGTVTDSEREALLHAAHIVAIPSYHEGFCKPAVEALRSGAVLVGYAAANLPAIANGFGRMVPPGDKQALADALAQVTEGISRALGAPPTALIPLDRGPTTIADFDSASRSYVDQFSLACIAPMIRERTCNVLRIDGQRLANGPETHQVRTFPALASRHIAANARVFATRNDLIEELGIPRGEVVAEVGVALGDFSEFLLQTLEPSTFVAIDIFKLHEIPELWGRPTAEIFAGRTHLEFYRDRFTRYGDRIKLEVGLSHEMLAKFPDETLGLIYIDAAHDFENVRRDALLAMRKTRRGGTIVFNDYTVFDHVLGVPYGVVPAVNELLVGSDWHVVGFALQSHMFCDIAIRRVPPIADEKARAAIAAPATRKRIVVTPDDILREQKRDSLNRICTLSDWSAWGELSNVMNELNDSVCIHRKSWEYALCIMGLQRLGVVSEEATGLAVGAGSEGPLYYFANKINQMIATDLYDDQFREATCEMLTDPERFAPFPYRKDHLQVMKMSGDDLKFPDESFDFVFSLSSIEHFGSRATQRRALDEMKRVTRLGGVVCIATELLLNDSKHDEYFTLDELEEMFLHAKGLRLDGGELDLRIAKSLVDYPVDLGHSKNINASPHITVKKGDNIWTSVMLFFRRID